MSLGLLYQFADTCEKVQRCRNICACANSGHLDLLRAGAHWKRVSLWAYSTICGNLCLSLTQNMRRPNTACRVKHETSYLFSVYYIVDTNPVEDRAKCRYVRGRFQTIFLKISVIMTLSLRPPPLSVMAKAAGSHTWTCGQWQIYM